MSQSASPYRGSIRSASRRLVAGLAAIVAAGAANAGEAPHHVEDQPLAPGYGELGFEPPQPGSYTLPPLGAAADGAVLDSDGTPTTLHALMDDKVVLLSFIYTSCSDVNGCPLASAVLHQVGHRLRQETDLLGRVRLLSVSFDPGRDTPEVMARYGRTFVADGLDWRFLTTRDTAELEPILAAYGQALTREYDDAGRYRGSLSHVLRVFLIDSSHRIRNNYSVSYLHADTLVADIRTLLLEAGRAETGIDDGGAPAESRRVRGPGDDREGYEDAGYRSRSVALSARRGERVDLLARLAEPRLGLPHLRSPADNPMTHEKVALGRKLFYDRRLSLNGTFSCAMCHIPEQGFTSNELATSVGIEGRTVRRNAPTLYNVGYVERLFHDGRETRLEHQVWGPLLAKNEMGNPSIGVVIEKIRGLADYGGLFEEAFPSRGLRLETVGMAIASYERTLVSGRSAFDRWRYGGDEDALDESASRGYRLFTGKAGCDSCHEIGSEYALFSDGAFHNTGVGYAAATRDTPVEPVLIAPGVYLELDPASVRQVSERRPSDLGRYEITQDPDDRWKYRTPTLRNVALTPPYMHDGSLSTLDDVVAFYDRGGVPNEVLDEKIRPLDLRGDERADLVAFLESLTGDDVDALIADGFAAPVGAPVRRP